MILVFILLGAVVGFILGVSPSIPGIVNEWLVIGGLIGAVVLYPIYSIIGSIAEKSNEATRKKLVAEGATCGSCTNSYCIYKNEKNLIKHGIRADLSRANPCSGHSRAKFV